MNKKIKDFRKEIDKIDEEIVKLLLRRMDLAKRVGELKKKDNLAVKDRLREKEIINRLAQVAGGQITKDQLSRIFSPVFKFTKKAQK